MVRTASVDETRAVAAALAPLAGRGDLVLLVGELGAGKTAFVQGFAAACGVQEPVTSPTFTLVHEYRGRCRIHHLDVYRLERLGELADLGLAELLDDGGVTLIEWGDAIASALPADYLEVHFAFGEGDDERRLRLRAVGVRWPARWRRVLESLEPWRC
jgi:tRNA threonylcarbamoyladenosine biosynthesis protein TsaE